MTWYRFNIVFPIVVGIVCIYLSTSHRTIPVVISLASEYEQPIQHTDNPHEHGKPLYDVDRVSICSDYIQEIHSLATEVAELRNRLVQVYNGLHYIDRVEEKPIQCSRQEFMVDVGC